LRIREFLSSFSYVKAHIRDWEEEIVGIAQNSKDVRPGYAFFALVGSSCDGHAFLWEAVDRGARLLVGEREEPFLALGEDISWVCVEQSRRALALASHAFFGFPSQRMHVVGVTGTNGKTTTCFLIQSILEKSGVPCGLLTTARNIVGPFEWEPPNTTMESLFLAQSLRRMETLGIHHAVLEVSSHGLALWRVEGILFDVAVFTNIVPEHLEFHRTFEHYWQSKKRLAEMVEENLSKPFPRVIVANGEDEHILAMVRSLGVPLLRFGFLKGLEVQAACVQWDHSSSIFQALTPWGHFEVFLPLPGKHNVYNALGAIAVGLALGVCREAIQEGLRHPRRIPGRWEVIEAPQGFKVIVDFAHNWHGLEHALRTAKALKPRRLITVFGCGGERDRSKRPQMGRVVAAFSDVCIVTTDNPRGEDPLQTAQDAVWGIEEIAREKPVEWFVILDRVEAIRLALSLAREGDVVFLAGKGPERFQVYATGSVPHNDYEVARQLLFPEGRRDVVHP